MRIWRALKFSGTGLLRYGVYLLPNAGTARKTFDEQSIQIQAGSGITHIFTVEADWPEQNTVLVALYDRTAEYKEAVTRLAALKRKFAKLSKTETRHRLAAIHRDAAAILARDFFRAESHQQMQSALRDAESAFNACFALDEPHVARRKIRWYDRKRFKGRTWATSERMWIDRVAFAWLIRRFIDPTAQILWLKKNRGSS